MRLLYDEALGGICIQRCYGLDGKIQLPEEVEGRPVKELAAYVFSDTVRGREVPPEAYEGEEGLYGVRVRELTLPPQVAKVGAYAFYNCFNLTRLSFCSTVEDWGAGVFTGCTGITELDIRIVPGRKSCFKEVLSELHQTLAVDYRDELGNLQARLIFPEYFEESVENTPARIIMREMHGCGHIYRYSFAGSVFDFAEYDRLFPLVQVQEKPGLVTRLALYRLYWSHGLTETAGQEYWGYLLAHVREGTAGLMERQEEDILRWMAQDVHTGAAELDSMLAAAAAANSAPCCAFLMDVKHRRFPAGKERKRTFEL